MRTPRVVFITGAGRSGTTLLGSLLGEIPGIIHVGEIIHFWLNSHKPDVRCGCGNQLGKCDFWVEVVRDAFGSLSKEKATSLFQECRNGARISHSILLLSRTTRRRVAARIRNFLTALSQLYASIAKTSNCNVIIDSSKSPGLGCLVETIENISFSSIHMTRDPRAVAFSWTREKIDPAWGRPMPRHHVVSSALTWLWGELFVSSTLAKNTSNYTHIRYEDLVSDLAKTLASVVSFLRLDAPGLPSNTSGIILGTNHTVAGNPIRFHRG